MSEKYDTLLSLSLDVPEAVRQDSALLGNAYQPDDGTWQVVFRYVGEEAAIEEQIGRFTRLSLGYGVRILTDKALENWQKSIRLSISNCREILIMKW